MKAAEILTRAAELVGGDREATHGDKTKNHAAIAAVWNGLLTARRTWRGDTPLDAEDVAKLMVGLKLARTYGGAYNPDDYVDGAGYFGCAGEIRARQEAVTQSWVRAAQEQRPQDPALAAAMAGARRIAEDDGA